MRRTLAVIAALTILFSAAVQSDAALRISATASTANHIDIGTSPGLLDAQNAFSMVMVFRLNANTGTYNFLCGRGAGSGTMSLRNWAILCDSGSGAGGSTNRLRFAWVRGSTEEGGDSDADGALTVGRWHQLVFTYNGTTTVRCYLNGVECWAPTITGPPNNNTVAFRFGHDAQAGGATGGPVDIAEVEVLSNVLTQAEVTALFNDFVPATAAGTLYRVRDVVAGKSVSNYWDMLGNETNPTDKAGSLNGTSSGVTLPSSTFLDHPPMREPIIHVRADAGLFSDAGVTAAVAEGRVQQWNDQSGRKLHLTQTTAGLQPRWLRTNKRAPYVWFDKFDAGAQAWRYPQFTFPTNVRLNSQNFTAVTVSRLQSMSSNGEAAGNNNFFYTLWQIDGGGNTRFNVGSVASGDLEQSAIVRFAGVDSGLAGAALYSPSSPSLFIVEGGAAAANVWVNDGVGNNTKSFSAASATGASGQGTLGGHNSNTQFSYWGGIYEFRLFNTQLGTTARAAERSRAASLWPITLAPAELLFVHGSSSAEGYASIHDNGIASQLFEKTSRFRNAWVYNMGKGSARLNTTTTDAGDATGTVWTHSTSATKSTDHIAADWPGVPVSMLNWLGTNDLANTRTAADILSDGDEPDIKDFIDARRTAIGATRIKTSALMQISANNEFDAGEQTQRATLNAAMFTDPGYGVQWNKVIRLNPLLDDLASAAADPFTISDNKHMNDAGFELRYLDVKQALFQDSMRNRTRGGRLR